MAAAQFPFPRETFVERLKVASTRGRAALVLGCAVSVVTVTGALGMVAGASSSTVASVASAAGGPATAAGGSTSTTSGSRTPSTSGTSSASTTMVRTGNILPGLANAISLGATPPSTGMTVDIGLARPDPTGESRLLSQIYTPSSPLYHHFLTPAQFDARFAVPAASVAATEAWLRSGGLTIGYVSPAGDLLSAHGTTGQLARLMGTSFGTYKVGPIGFIANTVEPLVPSNLPITEVAGLNTLQRVWTEQQVAALDGTKFSASPALHPSATTNSYVGTLVPQDLWGVYDAPKSDTGQGETAGMFGVGYSNGVVSDLRVYEQRMSLPQVPVRVVDESTLPGNPTPNDGDVLGDAEWNLDTQAISGMAPGLSQLDMYFASTEFDADMAVMISSWATDPNGPKQMNASFGECESDPLAKPLQPVSSLNFGQGIIGNQLQVLVDQPLSQAVIEGKTLFAAAGDTGGSCPAVVVPVLGAGNGVTPQPLPVDAGYPCASAFAVCVGGTVVTTNGTTNPGATGAPSTDATSTPTRVSETAWAYTGGGPALDIPEPGYQSKVPAIDLPCVSPLTGDGKMTPIPPGTTCRGTPDVAAMSGSGLPDGLVLGNNAYLTNIDMMPTPIGGTSLSSPLTVGMWARVQAASPEVKGGFGGLGFANETFYAVGEGANATKDFTDITQNELPTGNFYQQAGPGWDYASGWGALDVANMIRDVDGDAALTPTHAPSSPVSASPPTNVCSAQMTSPVGNALDTTLVSPVGAFMNDPALDITSATVAPSSDGQNLVVTISGPGLSTMGPVDAIDGYSFFVDWTYNGKTYFAEAAVNQPMNLPPTLITNSVPAPLSLPIGQVSFGDGVSSSDNLTVSNPDTGSFTSNASGGTFTIDVRLSHIAPNGLPAGAALYYPFAFDVLPNGVLVPFAMDEATDPSQLLILGPGC